MPSEFITKMNIIGDGPLITKPEALFSDYKRSKIPNGCITFGSDLYIIQRNFLLHLGRTGYGTDWSDHDCRGYNAAASSMTKLDALFKTTLDQAAILLGIKDKDWTDAQIAMLIDKVIGDIILLFTPRKIYQYFQLLLAPEEDSSFTTGDEVVWAWEDFQSLMSSLTSRKYPIFNISLELAKMLTPIFKLSDGYGEKGLPDQLFMPLDHTKYINTPKKATVAIYNQLKTVLLQQSEGLIHAKKISLPWQMFSPDMITSYDVYDITSREAMLWREAMTFHYYDGGAQQDAFMTGDFYGAHHTSRVLPIPENGRLDDIFSLLPLISDQYHATNNPYCMTEESQPTTVEDAFEATKIAINDTVWTFPCPDSDFVNTIGITSNSLMPTLFFKGAGDASQVLAAKQLHPLVYPKMLTVTGITQTVFEDALAGKLIKLWMGDKWNSNSGEKMNRPSRKDFRKPRSQRTQVTKEV